MAADKRSATALSPGQKTAVIDNTLLSRLVALDVAEYLPLVFKRVLVPPEVKHEARKAPGKGWKQLRKLINEMAGFFVDCREVDEVVKEILKADLDSGEAAAIAQADFTDSVILIDERKGVARAATMSLTVVRTGRLLCLLKEAGVISEVNLYLDRLAAHGFWLSENDRKLILREAGELE